LALHPDLSTGIKLETQTKEQLMLGAEEQRRWEFFYKNICGWQQKL